eukprot:jgi/Botrbrau1/12035/Bobra.0293s0012.1
MEARTAGGNLGVLHPTWAVFFYRALSFGPFICDQEMTNRVPECRDKGDFVSYCQSARTVFQAGELLPRSALVKLMKVSLMDISLSAIASLLKIGHFSSAETIFLDRSVWGGRVVMGGQKVCRPKASGPGGPIGPHGHVLGQD